MRASNHHQTAHANLQIHHVLAHKHHYGSLHNHRQHDFLALGMWASSLRLITSRRHAFHSSFFVSLFVVLNSCTTSFSTESPYLFLDTHQEVGLNYREALLFLISNIPVFLTQKILMKFLPTLNTFWILESLNTDSRSVLIPYFLNSCSKINILFHDITLI